MHVCTFSNGTSEETAKYFDLRALGFLLDELAKKFCKFWHTVYVQIFKGCKFRGWHRLKIFAISFLRIRCPSQILWICSCFCQMIACGDGIMSNISELNLWRLLHSTGYNGQMSMPKLI